MWRSGREEGHASRSCVVKIMCFSFVLHVHPVTLVVWSRSKVSTVLGVRPVLPLHGTRPRLGEMEGDASRRPTKPHVVGSFLPRVRSGFCATKRIACTMRVFHSKISPARNDYSLHTLCFVFASSPVDLMTETWRSTTRTTPRMPYLELPAEKILC